MVELGTITDQTKRKKKNSALLAPKGARTGYVLKQRSNLGKYMERTQQAKQMSLEFTPAPSSLWETC